MKPFMALLLSLALTARWTASKPLPNPTTSSQSSKQVEIELMPLMKSNEPSNTAHVDPAHDVSEPPQIYTLHDTLMEELFPYKIPHPYQPFPLWPKTQLVVNPAQYKLLDQIHETLRADPFRFSSVDGGDIDFFNKQLGQNLKHKELHETFVELVKKTMRDLLTRQLRNRYGLKQDMLDGFKNKFLWLGWSNGAEWVEETAPKLLTNKFSL